MIHFQVLRRALRPKLFQQIERDRVEDKEKRKGEKKDSKRSEEKIGNESAKKKKVQILA